MALQAGDIILNKYHVEELIGQSTHSTTDVCRALHMDLQVYRVLKILRRDVSSGDVNRYYELQQCFQAGAQYGARINHPNIIHVHDYGQDGDSLVLVMEYAASGSLADRLQTFRQGGRMMSVSECLRIAREVADGLAAIHALDIVHRDLKPSNILFDAQGRSKIGDLGLAQVPSGLSMLSQVGQVGIVHPGTPAYMSPEQRNSTDYLSPASDVFSLGLIFFEMLTGRIYRNVRPGTLTSSVRSITPEWLDDLIARMLSEYPQDRPWDGAEVVGALRQESPPAVGSERRFAPAERGSTPGERGSTPVERGFAPVERGFAPVERGFAPVERSSTPAERGSTPAERSPATISRNSATASRSVASDDAQERHSSSAETAQERREDSPAPEVIPTRKPQPTSAPPRTPIVPIEPSPPQVPANEHHASEHPEPQPDSEPPSWLDDLAGVFPPVVTATAPSRNGSNTPPGVPPSIRIASAFDSAVPIDLIQIAGGPFLMGSGNGDPLASDDEKPQHEIVLMTYRMSKYPITCANYLQFVTATKRDWRWTSARKVDRATHPAAVVNWYDACAFCDWLTDVWRSEGLISMDERVRLPTEAEWEKAARGPYPGNEDARIWPWGNEPPDDTRLNFGNNDTEAVGSHSPHGDSPYGIADLAGNVWEWTSTLWSDMTNGQYGYPYTATDGRENPAAAGSVLRVLRGGSFYNTRAAVRCATRYRFNPGYDSRGVGFRIVAAPGPFVPST